MIIPKDKQVFFIVHCRLQYSRRKLPFTLLELLIGIAAGAVLMAALLTAFSSAWRFRNQAWDRNHRLAPLEAASRRLRLELQSAVPPSGVLAGPFLVTSRTEGTARRDQIEWVAATGMPNYERQDMAMPKIVYRVIESESGKWQLTRTADPNLPGVVASESNAPEAVILDNIYSFEVNCFDGETWYDRWDSTVNLNQLPEAIRVRVEFDTSHPFQPKEPMEILVELTAGTIDENEGGRE